MTVKDVIAKLQNTQEIVIAYKGAIVYAGAVKEINSDIPAEAINSEITVIWYSPIYHAIILEV